MNIKKKTLNKSITIKISTDLYEKFKEHVAAEGSISETVRKLMEERVNIIIRTKESIKNAIKHRHRYILDDIDLNLEDLGEDYLENIR